MSFEKVKKCTEKAIENAIYQRQIIEKTLAHNKNI